MNRTVAIVVTYNRKNLLPECLKALQASEAPCDILLVDNASTDGTAEVLASLFAGLRPGERADLTLPGTERGEAMTFRYRNTGKNLGGAGGFSYGLGEAYRLGYEYFWLMDDDTMVKPDSLTKLQEAAVRINAQVDGNGHEAGDRWGFISGLALWTDGAPCVMNYHELPATPEWNPEKKLVQEGIVRCRMATFVSFFTRREVVRQVGLPIADYFIWGDDTEYSNRISGQFPSYFASNSEVIHKMKDNEGAQSLVDMTDEARIRRSFYSIRNDLCTFRRESRKTGFKTWLNAVKLWWKILFKAKACKGLKLSVVNKAILSGLTFAPKIPMADSGRDRTE